MREHLGQAASRRKEQYDSKVKRCEFVPGQLVWYFYPRRKQGLSPKWQNYYTGPYRIVRVLDSHTVVIQRNKKSKCIVVHRDKLKPCLTEMQEMESFTPAAIEPEARVVPHLSPEPSPISQPEIYCDSDRETFNTRPKRITRRPDYLNDFVVNCVFQKSFTMAQRYVQEIRAKGLDCRACGRMFSERHVLKRHLEVFARRDRRHALLAEETLSAWPRRGRPKVPPYPIEADSRRYSRVCAVNTSGNRHSNYRQPHHSNSSDNRGPSPTQLERARRAAMSFVGFNGEFTPDALMKLTRDQWPKMTWSQCRVASAALFQGVLMGLKAGKQGIAGQENFNIDEWLERASRVFQHAKEMRDGRDVTRVCLTNTKSSHVRSIVCCPNANVPNVADLVNTSTDALNGPDDFSCEAAASGILSERLGLTEPDKEDNKAADEGNLPTTGDANSTIEVVASEIQTDDIHVVLEGTESSEPPQKDDVNLSLDGGSATVLHEPPLTDRCLRVVLERLDVPKPTSSVEDLVSEVLPALQQDTNVDNVAQSEAIADTSEQTTQKGPKEDRTKECRADGPRINPRKNQRMWSGLPQKRDGVSVTNAEAGRKDQGKPKASSSGSSSISTKTHPKEKSFEKLLAKADEPVLEKLAKKLSINKPSSSTKAKNSDDTHVSSKRKLDMTRPNHEQSNVKRYRDSSSEKKPTASEPRQGSAEDKKKNRSDSPQEKDSAGADPWKTMNWSQQMPPFWAFPWCMPPWWLTSPAGSMEVRNGSPSAMQPFGIRPPWTMMPGFPENFADPNTTNAANSSRQPGRREHN